jgi:hypothetical protein
MPTPGSEFGALLATLTVLERDGRQAEARPLRSRLRVALLELSLDELHEEIDAIRTAAGRLTDLPTGDGSSPVVAR